MILGFWKIGREAAMMNIGWWYYVVILGGIVGCVLWYMASKRKLAKQSKPTQRGVIK